MRRSLFDDVIGNATPSSCLEVIVVRDDKCREDGSAASVLRAVNTSSGLIPEEEGAT